MSTKSIRLTTAQPHHARPIVELIRIAYGEDPQQALDPTDMFTTWDVALKEHLKRFPQGQFIALDGKKVVGAALTLLTQRQPTQAPLPWLDAIGGLNGAAHDPEGEWMYGYEFVVHPAYRKHGIGTQLYQIRFEFIQKRNLRGYYAGGMLMGYQHYRQQLTPRQYGEKVIAGEIKDPTVSMQMNRGFRPVQVIENYLIEEAAGNTAVLIVWDNPTYTPAEAKIG